MVYIPTTVFVRSRGDDAQRLRQCLECVLRQNYDDYEVLVVVRPKDYDCIDLLSHLELEYINLRHVMTPATSRLIPEEHLVLSLGIMSARHDWVVLTQSDYEMEPDWLIRLMTSWEASYSKSKCGLKNLIPDVIVGATLPARSTMVHQWKQMTDFTIAQQRNIIYCVDACNMALRKSTFLDTGGFGKHSTLNSGVLQLWANARKNVAVANALVVQQTVKKSQHDTFSDIEWMETRRHLSTTLHYRTAFFMNCLKHHIMFWSMLLSVAFLLICEPLQFRYYIASIVFVYFCFVLISTITFNTKAHKFYGQRICYSVCLQKLLFPFIWLVTRMDYMFIRRRVFYKRLIS